QAQADPDQDGLTNNEECFYGTDPFNAHTANVAETDGDLVRAGYDPRTGRMLDSDNDGIPDPIERQIGTDPFNPDTDRDGYTDCQELKYGYNPSVPAPKDALSDHPLPVPLPSIQQYLHY